MVVVIVLTVLPVASYRHTLLKKSLPLDKLFHTNHGRIGTTLAASIIILVFKQLAFLKTSSALSSTIVCPRGGFIPLGGPGV
jgi:hypothetical protein